LAIASNNAFYPLLINSFKPLYLNNCEIFFSNVDLIPIVFGFHNELVRAIEEKDSVKASEIMTKLLEHGMTNYFDMVKDK